MKHIAKVLILFILILTMTGCSDNGSGQDRVNSGNSVNKVISEQMDNAETKDRDESSENLDIDESNSDELPKDGNEITDSTSTPENPAAEENKLSEPVAADGVDYDLTAMSSDMVYATVYQMMVDPDTYIGKTIRMDGLYYTGYDENTKSYYHYCIIQDALACCAQGLEFVWGDGSHIYPDEYPEENTGVIVQGVFETYQEDSSDYLYCRLKDATLEVADN